MHKKAKIVVIGGSGLIGKKLVNNLREHGLEVVAASPSSGVNTLTGEGLAEALAGAQVVVDVANSPSFEDKVALEFFETSGRNLLAAETSAGVGHHVALSVVGTERLQEMGYFRAKLAQEHLIKTSRIPYTIVRATQFFEFMGGIAQSGTVGQTVHASTALVQPIAADDVADALAHVTLSAPVNDTIEIAGPERDGLDEFVGRFMRASKDPREIAGDPQARYFDLVLNDQSLTPGPNPLIGRTRFDEWLSRALPQKPVGDASPASSGFRPAPQKIAQAVLIFVCGIAALFVSTASADEVPDEKSKVTLADEKNLTRNDTK